MNVNVVKPGLAMSKMTQELKFALVIQFARAILPDALGCSKITSTLRDRLQIVVKFWLILFWLIFRRYGQTSKIYPLFKRLIFNVSFITIFIKNIIRLIAISLLSIINRLLVFISCYS